MSIKLALTRIIAAFITSGGASSLMTKMKSVHSTVCSLFPVSEKQVARASQSCDQEFNVALRKNYRNIFPLISPKKLPIL